MAMRVESILSAQKNVLYILLATTRLFALLNLALQVKQRFKQAAKSLVGGRRTCYIDLAFASSEAMTIAGRMPDDSVNRVTARLVEPEAFILINAIASSWLSGL